ncbi:redox-regulated ATPase YchF [symbiont of Argiope bruennichi]|uniref:redox-regulated ATPase YchF n=1 Tax=symbiont of Argiope bruennichi TaxID=2810479 RepID=UPI003DA3C3ED
MNLKIGIVGLPNIGKSTLFSLLTKKAANINNYPFATIDPSVAVCEVFNEKLDHLQKIFNAKKKVYNYIEFIDIAGLIKGASEGKGLGNKFLSHISECNAIALVIRFFPSKDVLHVENSINPIRDFEDLTFELVLSDLKKCEDNFFKVENKWKKNQHLPQLKEKKDALKKALSFLKDGKLLNQINFSEKELENIKEYNFLSLKKFFIVGNVDYLKRSKALEREFLNKTQNYHFFTIFVDFKTEYDLASIENEEDLNFMMKEFSLKKLNYFEILNLGIKVLNIEFFFTCGANEVRAWNFTKGSTAKQCAFLIHTDIGDNFIKAKRSNYNLVKNCHSEKEIEEKNLFSFVGRDYIVQQDDILFFLFKK